MAGRRKNTQKVKPAGTVEQQPLKFPAPADEKLDIPALETWLWDAACVIRGATDAPKFKDFILPLIFYKRLSDVFDDEFEKCAAKFGGEEIARAFIAEDHADALKTGRKPIVRFFVPHEYRWEAIRNCSRNLGEFVTEAMIEVERKNPGLQGALYLRDYNERQNNQRILDDDRLSGLIQEREWADKDLAEVLAKLDLNGRR